MNARAHAICSLTAAAVLLAGCGTPSTSNSTSGAPANESSGNGSGEASGTTFAGSGGLAVGEGGAGVSSGSLPLGSSGSPVANGSTGAEDGGIPMGASGVEESSGAMSSQSSGASTGSGSDLIDGATDSASSGGASSGTGSGRGGSGDAGPGTMLVGYLPDYNGSYAAYAKTIDFAKMTHVNFAFVNPPKCSGACTASSDMKFSLGQSDAAIAAFVDAAHAAGAKVIASVGGGGGDQQIIQFYNANLSAALVNSLDSYLTAHNLDGVDVDIEDPNNMGQPYATFVADLVATFHPEGKIVSAAVAQYLQSAMPDVALHAFDFINDMFYSPDIDGAKSELDFYAGQKNVPMNLINLGVPFFGQQGNDEPEYGQILSMYPNAWQSDSTNGITYVGEATMAKETLLGKQYGGVMIWELTGDAPPPHSLLNVIQNNL
jgi:chitinase